MAPSPGLDRQTDDPGIITTEDGLYGTKTNSFDYLSNVPARNVACWAPNISKFL